MRGEVDNRLGLPRLPERWQERVRRGELPAPHAEYLLDFAGHPDILTGMEAAFKIGSDYVRQGEFGMPLSSWRLFDIVVQVSRTMDAESPDGPRFEVKSDRRKALGVVTVRHPSTGKKEPRALSAAH